MSNNTFTIEPYLIITNSVKENLQMKENWKKIEGFDGKYYISANGEIYSIPAKRILKPCIGNTGYEVVCLRAPNGKSKQYTVHRLVALTFLPNPENLPIINHKDENKLNNKVDNLEWTTAKGNYQEYLKNNQRKVNKPKYFKKDLPNEEWLPIKENLLYEVSNLGRIRNIKTNRLLKFDEISRSFCVNSSCLFLCAE